MHLSSVIPANDTSESVFGHQNFPRQERGYLTMYTAIYLGQGNSDAVPVCLISKCQTLIQLILSSLTCFLLSIFINLQAHIVYQVIFPSICSDIDICIKFA